MDPNLHQQTMNSPYSPSFSSFYNTNLAEIAAGVSSNDGGREELDPNLRENQNMKSPYSPSFSSFFNANLAEVAARVTAADDGAQKDLDPSLEQQNMNSPYSPSFGSFYRVTADDKEEAFSSNEGGREELVLNLREKQNIKSPYSPSFSSFYNTNLAEVASRVTTEFDEEEEGLSSSDAHCEGAREDLEVVHEDEFIHSSSLKCGKTDSNLQQQNMNSPNSPSFSSFYNANLAKVAARVTTEFDEEEEALSSNDAHCDRAQGGVLEDEFEFNLPELDLSSDEIQPVYPVFDRDLLRGFNLLGEVKSRPSESSKVQNQLKNLFLHDACSSSSSDADDLDRIPEGTYCVWAPNMSPTASPSPGRCTKSSSTGSSAPEKVKAWKLRDLLKRSRSDGKDGNRRLMLLTPKKKETPGKESPARVPAKSKRKSYLPYKQDLLGFFVTPQVLRKSHFPNFR